MLKFRTVLSPVLIRSVLIITILHSVPVVAEEMDVKKIFPNGLFKKNQDLVLVIYGDGIKRSDTVVQALKDRGISALAIKGNEEGFVRVFANNGLWPSYYGQKRIDNGELVENIASGVLGRKPLDVTGPVSRKQAYRVSTGTIIIHYGQGREADVRKAVQELKEFSQHLSITATPVAGAKPGLVSIFVNGTPPLEISMEGIADPSRPRREKNTFRPKSEKSISGLIVSYTAERYFKKIVKQWSDVSELVDKERNVIDTKLREIRMEIARLEQENKELSIQNKELSIQLCGREKC